MLNVQNKNSSYFVEWIPNNVSPPSLCSTVRLLRCHICDCQALELIGWL